MREFGVSQWYQWYTNIAQGLTNGTIGNTICTNGNANGTIDSPSGTIGTIGTIGKPMVILVPLATNGYHRENPERSQSMAIVLSVQRMTNLLIRLFEWAVCSASLLFRFTTHVFSYGAAVIIVFLFPPLTNNEDVLKRSKVNAHFS